MVYCLAVALYHDQNINSFLDEFPNVKNTLACIVRSFIKLLEPTNQVIEVHRNSIVRVLGTFLPKLADGWSPQQGPVFIFGSQVDTTAQRRFVIVTRRETLKCSNQGP